MPTATRAPIVCFFDADCGFCTAAAEYALRHASQGALEMRPNSEVEALPDGVTEETTDRTIVVVMPDGRVFTRVAGVAAVASAIRGWRWLAPLIRLPGIRHALGPCYDLVSARRRKISQLLGFRACRAPESRT